MQTAEMRFFRAVAGYRLADHKRKEDNGKGKVIPVLCFLTEHHAKKVYWGSGGIAPRIP